MDSSGRRAPSLVLWILILGGIGFAAGFMGPIVFAPDANQGPLVGIFISGPGGAVLGLLLYVICRVLRTSGTGQWTLMWMSGAILSLVTILTILPAPELRGYLFDTEIRGCAAPADSADNAVRYWQDRIARVTWAAPRANWEADARRRLQDADAVVLKVAIVRENGIYENRKPWNSGKISPSGWHPPQGTEQKIYYDEYDGGRCSDYPVGSRSVHFVSYALPEMMGNSADWPPRELASFLNLLTLEPVPEPYRTLAAN